MTALHIACRDGRTDMADIIIQAAEKQAKMTYSGKHQPNIQELLNMEGPKVVLAFTPFNSDSCSRD